jgi:glutaredoxin
MTRPRILALFASASAALLLAGAAQAQLYRSVGPDGRVTYSDQPPAANARGSGGASDGTGSGGGGALPYELNQTAQKFPVTLYTANDCAACNSGRSLLVARGVPFTEKTIQSNDDIAALKRLSGGDNLPVVTIGGQRLTGFSDQDWSQYLDAAGYPKTSQLPSGYRRPAAAPLVEAAAAASPAPAANTPVQPPQPSGPAPSIAPVRNANNPTGVRF